MENFFQNYKEMRMERYMNNAELYKIRDDLEHFDERLDECFAEGSLHWIDNNTFIGTEPSGDILRVAFFTKVNSDYYFLGKRYDLAEMWHALEDLRMYILAKCPQLGPR